MQFKTIRLLSAKTIGIDLYDKSLRVVEENQEI
ncbi:MAG: hypothetical protein K0R80_1176 [Clostridia bacterium]|jgi:hypothetical protein|nr:hypothetical protein [Clostridia bacterium]